jgi:hypothetical protein
VRRCRDDRRCAEYGGLATGHDVRHLNGGRGELGLDLRSKVGFEPGCLTADDDI